MFLCRCSSTPQGYDLLMTSLRDPKERVQRAVLNVFLPALGMWARELGRLEHHLMHSLLKQLEDTVKAIPCCVESLFSHRCLPAVCRGARVDRRMNVFYSL